MSYRIQTKVLKQNLLNGLNWNSLKKSGSVLGGGSFSQVLEYSHSETNELYAIKVIPYLKEDKQKIKQEIEILQKICDHPEMQNFCANYYGYVKYAEIKKKDDEKTIRKFIALVFELADGNLEELLLRRAEKNEQGLSFEELKDLIRTIGDGMLKLQSLNIAHRDIKPINILYFKSQGNKIQFKLTDFGEVKFDADADAEATLKGTPKYLAPEINYELMHDLAKSKTDVFKSDVYSMGLTIIFSILIKGPFDGVTKKKCIRKNEYKLNPRENKEGPYDIKIKGLIEEICEKFKTEPKIMPLKILLEKCLQYNPTNRIDWEQFKVFALDLFVEQQKIIAPPEEIKMECDICDQKEKKIKQFEKIIDQKDIFIKILLERNSKLVRLLDSERIKRETAENNLKEILENQRTPERNKNFENIEKSDEKNENSLQKELFNQHLIENKLQQIFNVMQKKEESKEEEKKNKKEEEFEKAMMSHLFEQFPKNEKQEDFEVKYIYFNKKKSYFDSFIKKKKWKD